MKDALPILAIGLVAYLILTSSKKNNVVSPPRELYQGNLDGTNVPSEYYDSQGKLKSNLPNAFYQMVAYYDPGSDRKWHYKG